MSVNGQFAEMPALKSLTVLCHTCGSLINSRCLVVMAVNSQFTKMPALERIAQGQYFVIRVAE